MDPPILFPIFPRIYPPPPPNGGSFAATPTFVSYCQLSPHTANSALRGSYVGLDFAKIQSNPTTEAWWWPLLTEAWNGCPLRWWGWNGCWWNRSASVTDRRALSRRTQARRAPPHAASPASLGKRSASTQFHFYCRNTSGSPGNSYNPGSYPPPPPPTSR